MTNLLINTLCAATTDRPEAAFAYMPDGTTVTYGAFFAEAAQIAAALTDEGLKPGDRVAAQVQKSLKALQLYVGTVMAGGVFLPLNTAYKAAELAHFINDATPTIFVCDPAAERDISALTSATVLTLDKTGMGRLTDAAASSDVGFATVSREADDLAAILYLSLIHI